MTAAELLRAAADTIESRGFEYDTAGMSQERSMPRIVELYELMTGNRISIQNGYDFLIALKTARLETSPGHTDSYIDRLAYMALKSEYEKNRAKQVTYA